MTNMESPHVVIIDDDRDYASQLVRSLGTESIHVLSLSNLDDFWQVDYSQTCALIVDVYLGRQGGQDEAMRVTQFLRRVREMLPDVQIAIHSGKAVPIDIIKATGRGEYLYVPKAEDWTLDSLRAFVNIAASRAEKTENVWLRSQENVVAASEEVIADFKACIDEFAKATAAGQPFDVVAEKLLGDLMARSEGKQGFWLLVDESSGRLRSSGSIGCSRRIRGRKISSALQSRASASELSNTKPQIIVADTSEFLDGFNGLIQEPRVVICISNIEDFGLKVHFVIGISANRSVSIESKLTPYLTALDRMIDFVPFLFSKLELGKINSAARKASQAVPLFLVIGQVFLSLLSMALFLAASIAVIFGSLLLLTSAIGLPDLAADFDHYLNHPSELRINLEHYGTGLVNGVEITVLAITLFLLGVGISCMLSHPRTRRIPGALRYLDDPFEMKRALVMAICVLAAVEALKAILELTTTTSNSELIVYGAKIISLVALIVTLAILIVGMSRSRPIHETPIQE